MSFILDALKKSETDRQRQSGPALYEAKLATPRTQLPLWAIGLGVVLVANLALVMWVLFRGRSNEGSAQAATTGQPYAAQSAAGQPGAVAPPGAAALQGGVVQSGPVQQPVYAPQAGAAQPPPQYPPQYSPNGQSFAPNAQEYPPQNAQALAPNGQGYSVQNGQALTPNARALLQQQPLQGAPPGAPVNQSAPPMQAGQVADASQSSNADDYAPATEPTNSSGFHVRKATESGLQLYSDAAATGGLPELRVDMHTYAPRPQDRFVLINMKKAREGDMLPGGVRVESITPDGVVVSHNGAQFLLPK